MSRGWESKSVESQQASADWNASEPQPGAQTGPQAVPSPGLGRAPAVRSTNITEDAEQRRKRQALELQRERVLSERTSSPHRRTALEAALLEIEEKLSELGWTVHL